MHDEMTFVERLHNDLRDVRWPEPAVLRARARRRRRRAMVGAAIAVLLLAGGPMIVGMRLVAPPTSSLQSQASSPAPAAIPQEALVQPGDIAAKTDPPLGQAGLGEPVRIDQMLLVCLESQGRTTYWETSRYSRSQTLLRTSARTEPGPADVVFSQDVYRLAPERVAGFFMRLDAMLAPCARWRSEGEAQWGGRIARAEADHRWEVTDRDFAGDEAMLIRQTVTETRNLDTGGSRGTARPETTAVLRVGDLVTVLRLGRDGTESELRRLAAVAADRLCVAANPVC
ncbi:hypothetical protein Vqi01_11230 [Micromonospora qiuiae]|uniref:PknH-like extracellular domain-containing protein n=1 Tax=Micromonospora qiuiae TaxID=502268 RepID=A0ABQ4J725_9ACTN|nr:hypothetical protein [Micromonospora qiuiae]GIJ25961.1 hypothetical protein Vqi01_11230 [Micromonospora qiuiae]